MQNFELLSSGLDVAPLNEVLKRQPELFDEITGRQDYPGSAHKDTKCIFLRWCRGLDISAAFTEIPAFDFPAIAKLKEAHELINYAVHRVGGKELGRILVAKLQGVGRIQPHVDEGLYADHYERFHVVLDSEASFFRCGSEITEMKPGELWWFNHKVEHQVWNASLKDRLHLIIDCVAPNFRRERLAHAV